MSTIETASSATSVSPPAKRRRWRWLMHVAWLVITLLALTGGFLLGIRAGAGALGMISIDNDRHGYFGQVRLSLRLIANDDIAAHRRSEDWMLRQNVVALSVAPRYGDCRPKEKQTLADARRYIDAHPDPAFPLADVLRSGFNYCDKAEEKLSPWFMFGL